MGLLIRHAEAADEKTLVEQFQLLNRFENEITRTILTDTASAEASYISARDHAAANHGAGLVAVLDETIVGFLYFIIRDDDAYVREDMRRYGHVTELFVVETSRGQGVARALMAEAEAMARNGGAKRMTIGVLVGNDAALGAYTSFGFKPYHTRLSKTFE